MEPCPLVFEPRFVPKVWGGRRLAAWGKALPEGQLIGESWELFDDAQGSARVVGGPAQGATLRALCESWGEALVGPGHPDWIRKFPLLIKFLDAREDLSVQVHPDDRLAREMEGPGALGKNEVWVVLEKGVGAHLLSGFRQAVDADMLKEALESGTVGPLLNSVAVQAGDVVDLPAGRVHALGAGCLVAEVQQNSDLTYRVWDYLRLENGVQRTLHVPQALRALRFDSPFSHEDGITRAANVPEDGVRPLADGASFTVRRLRFSGPHEVPVADRPRVIMALEGSLRLAWGAGQGMMVPWGTTALVPAAVGLSMAPERGQAALLLIEPKWDPSKR